MTMYASQKINTDPNPPHVVAGYGRRNGKPVTWRGQARDDDHAIEQFDAAYPNSDPHTYGQVPRSEFGNNPNPLLIQFRDHLAGLVDGWRIAPSEARHWLELLKRDPGMNDSCLWGEWMVGGKADHIEHLRKVLTRIAAL